MADLVPLSRTADGYSLAGLEDVAAEVQGYLRVSRAENTKRAYAADWSDFCAWCAERGKSSLPADPRTIALYLAHLARRRRVSTLQRRVSAISQAHQAKGFDPPPTRSEVVAKVMAGIRRTYGTHEDGAAPLSVEELREILGALPDSLTGKRDRALLVLGFLGAFRRGELVGLDVQDLEVRPAGIVVRLRRSKTDQEGRGATKGIPRGRHPETCPVRALEAWLAAAGIRSGPVFRQVDRHGRVLGRLTDQSVALVLKRAAAAVGIPVERLSGHSLRAGLATAAAAAGAEERAIMKQTLHTSTAMVRRYIRDGDLFRDNAAAAVGL